MINKAEAVMMHLASAQAGYLKVIAECLSRQQGEVYSTLLGKIDNIYLKGGDAMAKITPEDFE